MGSSACSQNTPPAAQPDIEIGVSDALTGGLAGLGVPLQKAVRVAEHQINQVGVLDGQRVHFRVLDDLSDNTAAGLNVVQQLLNDKVPAILGPLASGQCLNVQAAIAAAHVVQISPSATSPTLTLAQPKHNRFFFRTAPPDDFQGKAIAKIVYDGVPASGAKPDAGPSSTIGGACRNVSLVNGDDGYGNALTAVVASSLSAMGGANIVTQDKVATVLASDYKQLASKIVAAQPDCLVLVVYSNVGAAFLRDLKATIKTDTTHDWSRFYVVGSDGEYDTAFIPKGQANPADPTSSNSTEGCIGTTPDSAPDTPEYQTFRNIWQEFYPGTEPDSYTANEYDAALLLALAIEKAGGATDGTKIRDALYQVTCPPNATCASTAVGPADYVTAIDDIRRGVDVHYTGASGSTDFDDYGNVTGDYAVWRVEKQPDGTFAYKTIAKIKSAQLE